MAVAVVGATAATVSEPAADRVAPAHTEAPTRGDRPVGAGSGGTGLGSGSAVGPVVSASTFHQDDGRPWIDTSDRAAVVAASEAALGAVTPPLRWTGDRGACEPGTSSARHRRATMTRVNYYRAMAGVAAVISEDVTLSSRAQEAAMMMSVEGELSHDPPSSYACFTDVGHQAAANSNLYLGRTGPAAVDGYIEDPGAKNIDVGHRTTLLHPPTRRMGVGDVAATEGGSSANVLWVFDDRVFDESTAGGAPSATPMREPDRFVAWPPRGYVPGELVHPRWSFTRAGVDLSQAEVRVFRPSAPAGEQELALTVVERTGAPGHVPLPTLVWELEIDQEPAVDTDYLVVITGVRPQHGSTPVLAATDGAGDDPDRAVADPPGAYAYTVRVLGREPGRELTPAEALARVTWAQG